MYDCIHYNIMNRLVQKFLFFCFALLLFSAGGQAETSLRKKEQSSQIRQTSVVFSGVSLQAPCIQPPPALLLTSHTTAGADHFTTLKLFSGSTALSIRRISAATDCFLKRKLSTTASKWLYIAYRKLRL